MAPIFLAVPIADKPATPPPITKTLAGGTLPAAVIWPKLMEQELTNLLTITYTGNENLSGAFTLKKNS